MVDMVQRFGLVAFLCGVISRGGRGAGARNSQPNMDGRRLRGDHQFVRADPTTLRASVDWIFRIECVVYARLCTRLHSSVGLRLYLNLQHVGQSEHAAAPHAEPVSLRRPGSRENRRCLCFIRQRDPARQMSSRSGTDQINCPSMKSMSH